MDLWTVDVGLEGSEERDSFTMGNLVPAFVGYKIMEMKNPV